ncbi:MAG: cupin-like domain-containing protein [Bauldia sp.]|nr:cupin-like domain-containing protein [Bauldia sp.]
MTVIAVERGAESRFPDEPFAIRHGLAGHPLLSLEALAVLAGRLDRDRVEFNSGKLKPDQRPEDVPTLDLAPPDVVRRIETADAWMVLKNVETMPEYRALIASALDDAAKALGRKSASAGGMRDFQGFIFVASANAVTPFHMDYEENFFVHLAGPKAMHVFDNRDRTLVPEEEMEVYPGKHRNLRYRADFEAKARVFEMQPGDGLFLPYTWPHWVRTGNRYAVSMAITWKSKRDVRLNALYFVNAVLRKMKLPQPVPGRHPWYDGTKVALYRTARAVVEPLRRSEGMRRRLRTVFFGRKANYYYGEKAEG